VLPHGKVSGQAEAGGRTGILVALGHAALFVALGGADLGRALADSAVAFVVLGACLAIITDVGGVNVLAVTCSRHSAAHAKPGCGRPCCVHYLASPAHLTVAGPQARARLIALDIIG
jgi:hypothetical protein